ncbi:Probable LRR receptor-like serine/threonine-protein kinase RKF3 [Linum perenne]
MSSAVLHFLTLLLLAPTTIAQTNTTSCPLNFSILLNLVTSNFGRLPVDSSQPCLPIRRGLRLLHSDYLRRTGSFLPPLSSAESCWANFQRLVNEYIPNFDVRTSCGFETPWISQGCLNITTADDFKALVSRDSLDNVASNCNQSLENRSPCAACTTALSRLQALYFPRTSSVGNISDCQVYPWIYTAAIVNPLGPSDKGTARCLFSLHFSSGESNPRKKKLAMILAVCLGSLAVVFVIAGVLIMRNRKSKRKGKKLGYVFRLGSIFRSTTLVKFTIDDIKKATKNFSRDNIIGLGGYGNVYKGIMSDGSEVAVKRFKNSSASGDATFAHEVEVIASVRHVNLVAMKGYCIASTAAEGHQRIIICELVKNGSLHDHLFSGGDHSSKLSWPIRQKIALGMARGIAYLHYGAQPGIIHRDIKASNVLLDEMFEAKVADFGLAKFNPEGMSHLSTKVAGTIGYVAPEYALYGQLTERSDVYSYGVVLLELLSGKKAITKVADDGSEPSLLTDWAWTMVREGRAVEVVEDGIMEEFVDKDVLERYVMVAVLCTHPQLHARPAMDQVVKMLEAELSVPSIPERPGILVDNLDRLMGNEQVFASSSGSGSGFRNSVGLSS